MKKVQIPPHISLLALCILLTGCHSSQSTVNRSDQDLTEILIDYQDPLPLNKFIEQVKLVRLEETNPLIGNIDNLNFTKDKIIVTDVKNAIVFIFDTTGRNTAIIHQQGRGPTEYLNLNYATLTPDGQTIAIHDNSAKKVLFFDLDGNFIEKKEVDFWFSDFEYIDDNQILCTTYGAQNDPGLANLENPNDLIYITDIDFKIKTGFLPNSNTDDQYMHAGPHLKKFGEDLYINPNFCDTLYCITDNTLESRYHVNLSNVGGVTNFEGNMTNEDVASILENKTTFPGLFTINEDFILFKISTPQGNRPMLWSKKSQKLYTLTNDPQINTQGKCGPFDFHFTTTSFSHKNQFITAMPAYILNMSTYTDQTLKKYPELVGLTDDSNPILIFYKLKEPTQ